MPVESIAEDLLGLRVVEDEHLHYSGMLLPARWEIGVNANDMPARRRFTIAHELGHWACQHLAGKTAVVFCRPADVSEATDRTLEREANIFAAELLMPEPAVRAEFPRVRQIASRFGVSDQAIGWRLYNLGLLDQ